MYSRSSAWCLPVMSARCCLLRTRPLIERSRYCADAHQDGGCPIEPRQYGDHRGEFTGPRSLGHHNRSVVDAFACGRFGTGCADYVRGGGRSVARLYCTAIRQARGIWIVGALARRLVCCVGCNVRRRTLGGQGAYSCLAVVSIRLGGSVWSSLNRRPSWRDSASGSGAHMGSGGGGFSGCHRCPPTILGRSLLPAQRLQIPMDYLPPSVSQGRLLQTRCALTFDPTRSRRQHEGAR